MFSELLLFGADLLGGGSEGSLAASQWQRRGQAGRGHLPAGQPLATAQPPPSKTLRCYAVVAAGVRFAGVLPLVSATVHFEAGDSRPRIDTLNKAGLMSWPQGDEEDMGELAVAWLQRKAPLHAAPADKRRHLAAAGVADRDLQTISPHHRQVVLCTDVAIHLWIIGSP